MKKKAYAVGNLANLSAIVVGSTPSCGLGLIEEEIELHLKDDSKTTKS
jgi:hypothetical protein